MTLNKHVLDIDPAAETARIVGWLRKNMAGLHKTGAVLGISGGIDSSVCLALCVKAYGPERVVSLLLPEQDSDPLSEDLARLLAAHYGVKPILEVITPALDGFRCYERRDAAIARVFPEFDAARGYKAKIVLPPGLLDEGTLNVYSLNTACWDGHVSEHWQHEEHPLEKLPGKKPEPPSKTDLHAPDKITPPDSKG